MNPEAGSVGAEGCCCGRQGGPHPVPWAGLVHILPWVACVRSREVGGLWGVTGLPETASPPGTESCPPVRFLSPGRKLQRGGRRGDTPAAPGKPPLQALSFPFRGWWGGQAGRLSGAGGCALPTSFAPSPLPHGPPKAEQLQLAGSPGRRSESACPVSFLRNLRPPIPASCECSAGLAPEGRPQGRRGSEAPPQAHTNTPQPTRASQMGGQGRDAQPLSY